MSLLKIPFIILDVIVMQITATPPNPPLPASEHIIPDWREIFLKSLARPCILFRTTHYAARFIEILLILATHLPPGPLAQYILIFNNATAQKIRITPIFLLGILLSVFGTVLRMKSYRTLGRLFTFELCIQKDHVLIVTGPYSVIRHPSYIGLIMTIIGACCSQLHGSWVKEFGISDTLGGQVLIGMWTWTAGAVIVSLLLRIPVEDKLLHTAFGTEWEVWARRVHYKLIPLLY